MFYCPPSHLIFSPAADGASQANGGDDDEQERERPDPNKFFSVLVHTRSFLKFLNAHAVSKTTIACKNGPFLPYSTLTASILKVFVKVTV
jgi:hypothetical protein